MRSGSMKKWITLAFVTILMGSLAGCSSSSDSQPADQKEITPAAGGTTDKAEDGKPTGGVKAMKGDVD